MKQGDKVFIRSLRAHGEVVSVNKNSITVQCRGVTVRCAIEDLTAGEPTKKKPIESPPPHRGSQKTGAAFLDLHGKTAREAEPLIVDALNQAIIKGFSELRINHGRGSGIIQKTTHKVLAKLDVVSAFKLSEGNPGVTLVYLQMR